MCVCLVIGLVVSRLVVANWNVRACLALCEILWSELVSLGAERVHAAVHADVGGRSLRSRDEMARPHAHLARPVISYMLRPRIHKWGWLKIKEAGLCRV